jgi:hypothetical protein
MKFLPKNFYDCHDEAYRIKLMGNLESSTTKLTQPPIKTN